MIPALGFRKTNNKKATSLTAVALLYS